MSPPGFRPALLSSITNLCGPFPPATPTSRSRNHDESSLCATRWSKVTMPPEGLRPWRATRGTPIFRAALVQTSAALRPFHSATAPFQGWRPLLLHLPPLLAWARAKACL